MHIALNCACRFIKQHEQNIYILSKLISCIWLIRCTSDFRLYILVEVLHLCPRERTFSCRNQTLTDKSIWQCDFNTCKDSIEMRHVQRTSQLYKLPCQSHNLQRIILLFYWTPQWFDFELRQKRRTKIEPFSCSINLRLWPNKLLIIHPQFCLLSK
jgi:hypothetical protein